MLQNCILENIFLFKLYDKYYLDALITKIILTKSEFLNKQTN